MKKNLEIINIDDDTFKAIKKNKAIIYVSETNAILEKLKEKDKIILKNDNSKKVLIRKIKSKYIVKNYKELSATLGRKIKKISPKNIDGENLIGIEFKKRNGIIGKIFLALLVLLIAIFTYLSVANLLMKYDNNKLQKKVKEVASEITYVVIEINPKIILELKDGKVINSGCLNSDCLTVFDNLDLKDISIKQATEKLYNRAKDKNVDISNGVILSSSDKNIEEEIKDLNYVYYKKIDKKQIKEEIKNVIDNKEIKEQKNQNEVNNDILAIYKKDKHYGSLYECKIVENELECYITKSFANRLSDEGDSIEEIMRNISDMRFLENIFDKFGFDYERGGIEGLNQSIINRVAVNGTSYPLFNGYSLATVNVSTSSDENNKNEEKYSEYNNFGIAIYNSHWYLNADFKIVVLPIEKIELISRTYNDGDLVTLTEEDGYLKITMGS